MEEARLYHFRYVSFVVFLAIAGLEGVESACAQASGPIQGPSQGLVQGPASAQAQSEFSYTVVDVDVPIVQSNLAEARQNAQLKAFQKAVDQILPTSVDAKLRAERITNAASYIKNYRVIEERQEGGALRSKIRCEWNPDDFLVFTNTNVSTAQKPIRFEITWRTDAAKWETAELLQFVKVQQKIDVDSFKLGRGIFTLNLVTNRPAGEVRTLVSQFLGPLFSVRWLEDDSSLQHSSEASESRPPPPNLRIESMPMPGDTQPVGPSPSSEIQKP